MRNALIGIFICYGVVSVHASGRPTQRPIKSAPAQIQASPAPARWVPYVSALALAVSTFTFYFQWIHARGARVTLLNDGDRQGSAVHPWSALPRNVQNDFPEFEQKYPGYALVRLLVLNTGDRPGFLKIESAVAVWPSVSTVSDDRPHVSYYTYVLVPALAVTDKLIVVRNLPDVEMKTDITVRLRLTTGGPAGRFRKHLRRESFNCELQICLIPRKTIAGGPPGGGSLASAAS